MDDLPILALRTSDVEVAAATLARIPGFHRRSAAPAADAAVAVDPNGDALLLVGPAVEDPGSHLQGAGVVLSPGEALTYDSHNLDDLAAELAANGMPAGPLTETSWGDRVLTVPGPDPYTVRFVQRLSRTPDDWVALYLRGPEVIEAAVAGLREEDLDLRPTTPGRDTEAKWSIRQIVHHVADGEDLWAMPVKVALATPGAHYRQDWYSPDNSWADQLDYAARNIAPALALLRASRVHIAQLIRHLPDAWDRAIQFTGSVRSEPGRASVGEIIAAQARHAFIHADAIQAIRSAHGR